MLNLPQERLLAQLFRTISETESTVESLRQSVCLCPGFSFHSVFRRIAPPPASRCSPLDLQRFLASLGLEASESEVQTVVRQFDSDGDVRWGVEEFGQLVLSAERMDLRRTVEGRRYGQVTLQIRTELTKLLNTELTYHRKVHSSLKSLTSSPGFTLEAAFHTLTSPGEHLITKRALEAFMRRMGLRLSQSDLDAILRRVDVDGDEALSIEELQGLFTTELAVEVGGSRGQSTELGEGRERVRGDAVDLVSIYWQNRLTALRKTEEMRETLRKRLDFDLDAAFTLFDPNSKGYSTVAECQAVLQTLGVRTTQTDLKNFFFLHNQGLAYHRLDFLTFGRLMDVEKEPRRDRKWVEKVTFSRETVYILGEIWATLLNESIRSHIVLKELVQTLGSESESLFRVMDIDRDGQISSDDVRSK